MELSYSSNKLRKQCEQDSAMRKAFDDQMSKKLKLRLGELKAARVVADLFAGPGRWEFLSGDRRGSMSGRLTANDRLIVEPLRDGEPIQTDDDEDWADAAKAASEAEVTEIVDYH